MLEGGARRPAKVSQRDVGTARRSLLTCGAHLGVHERGEDVHVAAPLPGRPEAYVAAAGPVQQAPPRPRFGPEGAPGRTPGAWGPR